MASAYLLVSHGSRDPRPQAAMEQLARLFCQSQTRTELSGWVQTASQNNWQLSSQSRLAAPERSKPLVGTACLELSAEPLHEQIRNFGSSLVCGNEFGVVANGCNRLQVMPLFLLPGVHVMEDIPAEVAIAQEALGEDVKIDLRPYLGTHPGLSRLLVNQLAGSKVEAWIILAHGSRRAGSKLPVEAMARQVGAVPAYWAVEPGLESCVRELVDRGYGEIGILPYFLFAGGITDAIARSVSELRVQFPDVSLRLAEPMGASAQLAGLIWDLMEKE